MSGTKLLLDTNILLYLLNGDETLADLLTGKRPYISFVTELELLSFQKLKSAEKRKILKLIDNCTIIDVNASIKDLTINIRQNNNLKLPDALIAATSKYLQIPLLSADNDFEKVKSLDLIYYEV